MVLVGYGRSDPRTIRVRIVSQLLLDQSQERVETPLTLGQRIDFVRGFLHRHYIAILLCLAVAVPLGAFNAFTSPNIYTASSTMMIETRKGPLETQPNASPLDAAWFETQLADLKSLNVLSYVVKQLHLADDLVFLQLGKRSARQDAGPRLG